MAFKKASDSDPQDHYLQAHSCRYCQKMLLPGTPQNVRTGLQYWQYDSQRTYVPYQKSLNEVEFRDETGSWSYLGLSVRDLEIASCAGCDFASALVLQVDYGFIKYHNVRSDDVQLFGSGSKGLGIYQLLPLSCLNPSQTKGLDMDLDHTFLVANYTNPDWWIPCDLWTADMSEEDDPQRGLGASKAFTADPLSQSTIESVKKWIKDCSDNENGVHKVCSLSGTKYLPSRLIEVQPQGAGYHLKLVSREPAKCSEYLTLSYCWGGDQEAALKVHNLHQYEKSIPWDNLPRTIQDAVMTTNKLGCQFLWVDALCILQDSPTDTAKEIAEMSQIYSSSTLTIMARRAEKAADGFLHKRALPSGTSTLRRRNGNGDIEPVNLMFRASVANEDNTRLDTRGWVMQEHILSRRLLTIGTYQTSWRCRQSQESTKIYTDGHIVSLQPTKGDPFRMEQIVSYHGATDDPSVGSVFHQTFQMDAIMSVTATPGYQKWRPDHDDITWKWYKLVEAYTARSLTVETGRILGISGIAKRFGELQLGRYLAGFWEKDLLSALTWTRVSSDGHVPARPSKYTGPSWSWTAVSAEVHFESSDMPPLVKLLSVNCVPAYKDAPFGSLESGTLKLRGPAIDIEYRHSGEHQESQWRYMKANGEYVDPDVSIEFDAWEPTTSWRRVTLLGINPPEWDEMEGIVLVQLDQTLYTRLGFFSVDPSKQSWDEDLEDPPKLPHFSQWVERTFEIM